MRNTVKFREELSEAKEFDNDIDLSYPGFERKFRKKYDDLLSDLEIQICKMILYGMSTQEIADLRVKSSDTIRKHRNNIREKMKLTGERKNLRKFLRRIWQS